MIRNIKMPDTILTYPKNLIIEQLSGTTISENVRSAPLQQPALASDGTVHSDASFFLCAITEEGLQVFSGRCVDPPSNWDESGKPLDREGNKYLKVKDYCGLRKLEFLLGEDTAIRRGYGPLKQTPIIICEGLFDFAWLRELGYWSTVCIMGTWLTEAKVRRLRAHGRPVIRFLDNDKAGNDSKEEIGRQLWGHVPILDVKYPDNMTDADPHSLPASIVHKMYRERKLLTKKPSYIMDEVPF